jgi:hypothetical protein
MRRSLALVAAILLSACQSKAAAPPQGIDGRPQDALPTAPSARIIIEHLPFQGDPIYVTLTRSTGEYHAKWVRWKASPHGNVLDQESTPLDSADTTFGPSEWTSLLQLIVQLPSAPPADTGYRPIAVTNTVRVLVTAGDSSWSITGYYNPAAALKSPFRTLACLAAEAVRAPDQQACHPNDAA